MDLNQIQGFIFDKDGTLFDFQATWGAWTGDVLNQFAAGDEVLANQLAEALCYDRAAKQLRKESTVIAGTPLEIAHLIAPLVNQPADEFLSTLNALAIKAPQALVPGVDTALEHLASAGKKLAVMTNDAQEPARAHLDQVGITKHFTAVVGSDSGFGAKPDPGPVLAAANKLGLESKACAMVGDSTHDLFAGRAAGCTTIAVLTGLASREDLAPHANMVLGSVAELKALVE